MPDLHGLHVLTPGSSNPASCLNSSRRSDLAHSTLRNRYTATPGQRVSDHRSSIRNERTTSTTRTTGPPSRTRRHTSRTCTPASTRSQTSSIGNRSGELSVPHHSRHVQRLHHHATTRLGYRRRSLVMIVIPNIDHPSMKSPSPGVQPLAPVGVAVRPWTFRLRAMALSSRRNRFKPVASAFGFSTVVPSEQTAIAPTPTSTPMVGPGFTGGACWPSSMQKQANHVLAVRLTVTSRMDPRNRRSSTIAPRPIFGRITTLPSTRTVSGSCPHEIPARASDA